MSTQHKYNPADTAVLIIEKVASGKVYTRGGWLDVVRRIDRLPPSLREWTWSKLSQHVDTEYLRSWSCYPYKEEVVTIAR